MQIGYNMLWKGVVITMIIFYVMSFIGYERMLYIEYNFPYNGGSYHKTEEIVEIVLQADEKYRVFAFSNTSDRSAFNVALGPEKDSLPEHRKLSMVIVCGQHGRELISSELCVHLILLLKGLERSEKLSHRLDMLEKKGVQFWVLPVANPWSRIFVENDIANNGCRRTNYNNVDLNRNFPTPHTIRSKHKKGHVEYAGSQDLSEWESNYTLSFIFDANAHILINVHSGSNAVLLPYDCSIIATHPFFDHMMHLAKLAINNASLPQSTLLGSGSSKMYESQGTLNDFATYRMGVPFVYTLEIYKGDVSDDISDEDMTPRQCTELFNPKKGEEYTAVIERWLLFIISMAEHAISEFEPTDYTP